MASTGAMGVAVEEYGDSGLLVTFGQGSPAERWTAAQNIARRLTESPPPGLTDCLASFDTVFVSFDPVVAVHAEIAEAVEVAASPTGGGDAPPPAREAATFVVPVAFGGDDGPELQAVAQLLELDPDAVVRLYCAEEWTVRLLGSPLGAPLLDRADLPARIRPVPRLAEPRSRLEAGSFGISGHQAIVYPLASPGGWQLIGRTLTPLVRLGEPPWVGLRPGDRMRLRAVPRLDDTRGPLTQEVP